MASFYHYSLGQLIFDCLPKFLKRPRKAETIQGEGKDIPFEYTDEQSAVLLKMSNHRKHDFRKEYLHGVTGSGKTAIYLKRIKDTIESGKSVLFLLPEINLTPQFVKTFTVSTCM